MKETRDKYDILPFPKVRQPIIDALRQAKCMNIIHALLEVDVTDTRNMIRQFKEKTGGSLSLTSFLIFCFAIAIDENKLMHAYRRGNKLIVYNQVDIAVDVERDIAGQKTPIYPYVIKAANRKTLREIHDEIRTAKENVDSRLITKWTNRYSYLPGFIRGILWRTFLGSPYWRKKLTGTVGVSSLGMFSKGAFWGIPISTYTLGIVVGGISEKPSIVKGQVEVREYLSITISFDHDIIDGAPAARFTQKLKELIESGYGIIEQAGGD